MDIGPMNRNDLAMRRLERDQPINPVVQKPNSSFTGEKIVAQGSSEVSQEMWQKKPPKKDKDSKHPDTEQQLQDMSENESEGDAESHKPDDDDQPHFLDVRV